MSAAPPRGRDLDASVRAFRMHGLELAAIGDAYRRQHPWSSVDRLAWLPGGRLLAASYRDVTVWDLDEDREVDRIKTPHTPKAVSPDGTRFVLEVATVAGGSGWTADAAWLWSPTEGRLAVLDGVFQTFAGFFPDGSFAATSAGRVFRFDRDGRRTAVWELPSHPPRSWFVTPFVVFPDGSMAGIGHAVQTPALFFAISPAGELRHRLVAGASSAIARHRDELLVPSGGALLRFEAATLAPREGPHPLHGLLRGGAVALHADDRGYAITIRDGISIVDLESGAACLGPAPPYSVSQFVFTPDGTRVVGAGIGGSIHVWDRRTGEELAPVERYDPVRALSALPGGGIAVGRSGSHAGSAPPLCPSFIDVVDGESLARTRRIDAGMGGGVTSIAVAPDGALGAMTYDGLLSVTPLDGETHMLPSTGDRGAGVVWRKNGELVSLFLNAAVVWDASTRRELRREERRFGTITTPLFEGSWETEDTDDPDELLACAPDGSLGVLSVRGDVLNETSWLFDGVRREPFAPGRHASSAAVNRDGTWAAVAFASSVELRAPGEPAPRAVCAFAGSVTALAISPDGRHWAAAHGHRIELRVGAAEAPAAFVDMTGADDRPSALAFLADGSLVAGTQRGNVLRFVLAA